MQNKTFNNLQDIYNFVVSFIEKQGCKSMAKEPFNESCMYRGKDNTKCAAGCLIKDEFYNSELEGSSISGRKGPEIMLAIKNSYPEIKEIPLAFELISKLQYWHDN